MAYRPRIFISHSAKEPEAKALCRAIKDALDATDFEVLWDASLETSQTWRAVIDEWIWRCDAAVLVLSKAATDSRYVAYEAALLRQRSKYAAGQFLLVPLWCPTVNESVLTDRMGALQLSEIQTDVKVDDWPANAGQRPCGIRSRLSKSLSRTCRPSRTDYERATTPRTC